MTEKTQVVHKTTRAHFKDLREVVLSLETSSRSWRAAGTRRGEGGWRQPSSAELRVSVSWLSRAWWQSRAQHSRAAGQGVAAGLWPGESEEPNSSEHTADSSKV